MVNTNTIEVHELRTGIAHAVVLADGQRQLAIALGVSQQAVSSWVRQGWVPLSRAREIEVLYGVPRSTLVNPRVAELVGEGGDAAAWESESEGGES